ncbi:hypothetical protein VTN02DRAFT_2772 [Thermoascus thermophilus]
MSHIIRSVGSMYVCIARHVHVHTQSVSQRVSQSVSQSIKSLSLEERGAYLSIYPSIYLSIFLCLILEFRARLYLYYIHGILPIIVTSRPCAVVTVLHFTVYLLHCCWHCQYTERNRWNRALVHSMTFYARERERERERDKPKSQSLATCWNTPRCLGEIQG